MRACRDAVRAADDVCPRESGHDLDMSDFAPMVDLREAAAVSWFRSSFKHGPAAMDSAIVALGDAFKGHAEVAALAPVDEVTGQPSSLFLAVDGDVSDDKTWDALIDAHRKLAASTSPEMAAGQREAAAYERLHMVVAPVSDARPLEEATNDWFGR